MVFVRTNPFNPLEAQYHRSLTIPLPEATADACTLINWGLKLLRRIYRLGFAYQKAGVILSELRQRMIAQASLFAAPEVDRGRQLIATLDVINRRLCRGMSRSAAGGMEKTWLMKRQRQSPWYTTDWAGYSPRRNFVGKTGVAGLLIECDNNP